MKSVTSVFLFVTMLSLAIAVPSPPTLAPQGVTTVVTSTADSGPGTLRQAMEQAQSGDTITFDPAVFPSTAPVTISITSELPHIRQGNLTIDASNAGVILDGSYMPGDWQPGLQIVDSDANTIRGLQISNFSGRAIDISGDSQHNVIGGDRSVGAGPFGQGNLLIHNGTGVILSTAGTSFNTITGNLIGTDASGAVGLGNGVNGVWIGDANGNTIGPDNVIAYSGRAGIEVDGLLSVHNTITQNSIHDNDNGWAGIALWNGGNAELAAPAIIEFDLQAGTVAGLTCAECAVEIFSDDDDEGALYEGRTTADDAGYFTFTKGVSFFGPHLTATATDASGNTSAFSAPAGAGQTIVVTSTADSGAGTLRQALVDAQSGDTVTFDPVIFPPTAPVTISVTSELPFPHVGNLTVDASNAGVIVDGSNVPGDWTACLQIVSSHGNAIRGLQVANFSGPGIAISGDAQYNVIGGDRSVGAGPFGQGNLLIHNDMGVVMSTGGTSDNTVTGNLIGTDAAGANGLGNRIGVGISEGANGNTIGPDNVIAYNGIAGIEVDGYHSVHNTITQNSIHDNGGKGIRTVWGANTELLPPTIFDFDLQAGAATGTACYHCAVEIFSDSGDEGAIYEGQATADGSGAFTFNKGAPFIGPHLTATATDGDGNTSQFSLPTSGTVRSLTLQHGNELTATHLQTRHSSELLDNRIGASYIGWDLTRFSEFYDLLLFRWGFKWARVAIHSQEPEYVHWDKPELVMSPMHDAVFTRMAENGLKMKYVLTFWDKATYPGGEGAPCARFKTEGEIERYLEFVRFIVRNFKDRIEYYEMWNEPDIENYCPKWIEVDDYINLVERTVPVIREEYPEAKIVVGAVSNLRFPPADEYLYTLLQSDIMPLVDVVSWHANGPAPDCEYFQDFYYEYPSIVQYIKDTASAHGFDGEYQGNELGYDVTEIAEPDSLCVYSPTVAAKYSGRGIVMHLGMDIRVHISRGTGNLGTNLCTVMAGAEAAALPMQIQTTVTNTVSYTFALPNDDWLVALWTDGIAAEYDPGVPTTVTLPGFVGHTATLLGSTDRTVTGVDVLHGFEQPIITSEEDGNLVIRNLLVKDYPIILRLSSTRYVFLPITVRDYPR